MKTLITLFILVGAFTATTHANYNWLEDSLAPVASECQAVDWVIGKDLVLVNLYCPEHNKNWGLERVQKRLFIDLVTKEWYRYNGWFYLID